MKIPSRWASRFAILAFVPLLFSCSLAQHYNRDSWQQPGAIMDSVGVRPGMVIGEAGAGDGYFTFHLAQRVGTNGKVFANDIDEDVLEEIEERMEREGVTNIVIVVGEIADPLFPKGKLDMVVMMNAFHDFGEPVAWMKNVIPSMKPDAPLVIIDHDPDKTRSGWSHFMTKDKLLAVMEETDFTLVHLYAFLERDNIYVFQLKPAR
jgi:ubiquinone/menaquinone biosynthesis C-methylase UbiE